MSTHLYDGAVRRYVFGDEAFTIAESYQNGRMSIGIGSKSFYFGQEEAAEIAALLHCFGAAGSLPPPEQIPLSVKALERLCAFPLPPASGMPASSPEALNWSLLLEAAAYIEEGKSLSPTRAESLVSRLRARAEEVRPAVLQVESAPAETAPTLMKFRDIAVGSDFGRPSYNPPGLIWRKRGASSAYPLTEGRRVNKAIHLTVEADEEIIVNAAIRNGDPLPDKKICR